MYSNEQHDKKNIFTSSFSTQFIIVSVSKDNDNLTHFKIHNKTCDNGVKTQKLHTVSNIASLTLVHWVAWFDQCESSIPNPIIFP